MACEPLLIGVTSHRDPAPDEVPALRARVANFLGTLALANPTLAVTVVTSLAEGGDQLVAEEALALGLRVIAVLPMTLSSYVDDFTADEARRRFETLLARATVVEMPEVDGAAILGSDAGAKHVRAWHYTQAGIYIASHSHLLLALWDGRPARGSGGTADVVTYHLDGIEPALIERRRNMAVLNRFGGSRERFAFHIVCSRNGREGAPAPGLGPLQVFWRSGGGQAEDGDGPMPAELQRMLDRLTAWQADLSRHCSGGNRATHTGTATPASSPIERRFAAADHLALLYRRRVIVAMRTLYSMAALMGIAFIGYEQLSQDSMIFVFLALFAAGVGIDRLAHKHAWHRKYLDYRALAEGLRVQMYWRRGGLATHDDAEFAHDDFLQKQDVELDWIRNVMRSAALEAAAMPATPVDLDAVVDAWVGTPGGDGQLGFYQRRSRERAATHRLTERLGALSLWTGIAICIFLAITIRVLPDDAKTALVALMGSLSVIAAVREAYAYRKADKELIKQYRYMQRIFAQARQAIDRAADDDAKRAILRELGEAALAEHAEWTLMHSERPLERAHI